jgi:hypothetical protein
VPGMVWRKSSFSGSGDASGANCVEVAVPRPGTISLRDSKNPRSSLRATATFLTWVKGR